MYKNRFIFIDALRGIAVFAMIETHIVNSIMLEEFRSGRIWNCINLMNGFVSVAFLFLAGSTFIISSRNKFTEFKNFNKPLLLYIRKLLFILLLAYALHLPILSIFRLDELSYNQLLFWFDCDILQNIVYSSLIALILLLISPKFEYLKYIYLLLAFIIIIISPKMLMINPYNYLPTFFASIIASTDFSKFGLFPWSGYFFAGAAFTHIFLNQREKIKFSKFAIIISIVTIIFCFLTKDYFTELFKIENWWNSFPTHTLFRLSGIILVFSLSYIAENKVKNLKYIKFLILPGRESLLVYLGHLIIIYGFIVNFGFNYLFGPRLHWALALIYILCMCIFFYFVSLSWNIFKSEKPKLATYTLLSIGLLILSFMFIY